MVGYRSYDTAVNWNIGTCSCSLALAVAVSYTHLEAVRALKGVAGTLGMTELFQAASVVVASIRKNEISHLQERCV